MGNNDEIDLFDLHTAASPASPESVPLNLRPIETETNMYSIEFYSKSGPPTPTVPLRIDRPSQPPQPAVQPAAQ
jgi:hypothetical protein